MHASVAAEVICVCVFSVCACARVNKELKKKKRGQDFCSK